MAADSALKAKPRDEHTDYSVHRLNVTPLPWNLLLSMAFHSSHQIYIEVINSLDQPNPKKI